MEEINMQAKLFSDFLDNADDKEFTMSELMDTGFFESEEEVEVFFVRAFGSKNYVTKETNEKQMEEMFAAIAKLASDPTSNIF